MSFGFSATNEDNEIIISSDLRNLHFITKRLASTNPPDRTRNFTTLFDGIAIYEWDVSSPITPVPFIYAPQGVRFGITAIRDKGNGNWTIEAVSSSSAPDLYVFADARAVQSGSYGLQVFRDDGSMAFDSSARALQVIGTHTVTHPTSPRSPYAPSGLDAKYCNSSSSDMSPQYSPNTENTISIGNLGATPLLFYFSLGQAALETRFRAFEEECDGAEVKGNCVGFRRQYEWLSFYWCFYRSTISWGTSGTNVEIYSNWTAVEHGCAWQENRDGGAFGVGTGSGSTFGGRWPYSNETLNLDPSTVIIANRSLYDD